MNNFVQRTLTGAIYVAVLISGAFFEIAFPIVFPLLMVLSLVEFYNMELGKKAIAKWLPAVIISVLLFYSVYMFLDTSRFILPVLLVMSLIAGIYGVLKLFGNQRFFKNDIAIILFGISYVALPFVLLSGLTFFGAEHWHWLLTLMVIIWLNDSFAYIFGVSFGKHRLYEKISPKKSWEGAIGGAAVTIGVALVANMSGWLSDLNEWQFVFITFIIIIAATLGDLIESMLKRSAGVKDSGTLLPGHGGFFDRLDSFILAVPVLMAILLIYNS